MTDNNCVVCFKNVRIYSVGECEHPVCYECSTRMRVLCRQNECPMCRHEMGMVVFTERIRPFKRMKKDYSSFNQEYRIAFENDYIQEAFENLLLYVCKKCHNKPFSSFDSLTEHMRRIHDLYSCDLCVDNLKIFPKEFRYYSRSDLNKHRRVGDIDDKSHRGHPLCEFCNIRYVDRDELYRHLRKDHLFCHICDSEGIQQFYGVYGMLRDHYKQDHYLCEEGDCLKEEFTSVFPTEIDLKAHKALVHCKNLRNKLAVKQARTLELEFTLAPRIGADRRNRYQGTNTLEYPDEESTSQQHSVPHMDSDPRNLMVTWDESAFPSLTNNPTLYSTPRSKPQPRGNKNRLAFNEQNFPALGSETSIKFNISNQLDPRPSSVVSSTNISVQVNRNKNRNNRAQTAGPSSSSVSLTWVEKAKEKKPANVPVPDKSQAEPGPSKPPSMNRNNFPKLTLGAGNTSGAASGSSNVNNEASKKNKKSSLSIHIEDHHDSRKSTYNEITNRNIPSSKPDKNDKKSTTSTKPKNKTTNGQSSSDSSKSNCILLNASRKKVKMKPEVDGYVSLNNLTASGTRNREPVAGSSGNSGNIPGPQSRNANDTNGVQKTNVCDTKLREENDKTKPAEKRKKDKNEIQSPKNKENKNDSKTNNKPTPTKKTNDKEKKPSTKDAENLLKESNKIVSKSDDSKLPENRNNQRKKSELRIGPLHETTNGELIDSNSNDSKTAVMFPPPGFESSITAPPGLSRASSDQCNQQLFNDNQISFTKIPEAMPIYQQPDDFVSRNSHLIDKISKSLMRNNEEAINDFKNTSLLYREGYISAPSYYLYCMENIENDKFDDVFVELVILLPNIMKQQELWTVHQSMKGDNSQTAKVEHCPVCLQILKPSDFTSHLTRHTLQTNTPLFSK